MSVNRTSSTDILTIIPTEKLFEIIPENLTKVLERKGSCNFIGNDEYWLLVCSYITDDASDAIWDIVKKSKNTVSYDPLFSARDIGNDAVANSPAWEFLAYLTRLSGNPKVPDIVFASQCRRANALGYEIWWDKNDREYPDMVYIDHLYRPSNQPPLVRCSLDEMIEKLEKIENGGELK